MVDIGSLVVIQDLNKFDHSVRSFREKWATQTETGMSTVSTATATAMAMPAPTSPEMRAEEKETGKNVSVRFYGYRWTTFDKIVGIVTEIFAEEHPDFDMLKIREQTGGVRYCRRFILENA